MKFTKEEISLCKQVAEKYRKEISDGDWFLRNDMKFEYALFLRVGKDLITGYIQGEICFMDDMSNVDIKKAIPLWTISDCLEFLRKEGFMVRLVEHEHYRTGKKSIECICYGHETKRDFSEQGDKDEVACLEAVLVVLEEKK